jgi:hypothetical protein
VCGPVTGRPLELLFHTKETAHRVVATATAVLEALAIGRRPEFAKCIWPAPVDNAFSSGIAHAFSQGGVCSKRTDSSREIIHIA